MNPFATKQRLTPEYHAAFHKWFRTAGTDAGDVQAASYESAGAAGGFTVPVIVSGDVVALAPPDSAIRRLATVVPTASDIKLPYETTEGTTALKPESGPSLTNFGGSDPAIAQFTLSAYQIGSAHDLSAELWQDVPLFSAFMAGSMARAQQAVENGYFISGTGVGQPQGMLGNVGAGVTVAPDSLGNLVSVDGLSQLIDTLKPDYHENAAFLMARPTAQIIRKAQQLSNQFASIWTRTDGRDYLYGYPVEYCAALPAAAHGATPILFGDFARGFIVGDRKSSALQAKMLDQVKALEGLITALFFRRTDGRVQCPEAIQSYSIS